MNLPMNTLVKQVFIEKTIREERAGPKFLF